MKLSAKTQYACLAMLELAGQYTSGATVCAGEIADRHGIPPQFLVQILRTLRGAGLVESLRGSQGGYRLSVPPHETTLADIVDAMEGRPHSEGARPAAPSSPCCVALQSAMEEATTAYRAVLEETTLAALVDASRAAEAAMYYI